MKSISCHHCYFYDGGSCLWFIKYGKEKEAKIIPETTINKGCKFYTTKLVRYIIDIFDGEIIYE